MQKMMLGIWFYICMAFMSCENKATNPATNLEKNGKITAVVDTDTPTENTEIGIKPSEADPEDPSVNRVAFYNVENLFDLEDEPIKNDEEFTPTGRNKWDKARYDKKINNLAKVIHYMGQPGILGLCEVENPVVLKDLVGNEQILSANYGILHQDSPDFRGIDVALLYDSKEYTLMDHKFTRINFPKEVVEDYTTRDFLHATLRNKNNLSCVCKSLAK